MQKLNRNTFDEIWKMRHLTVREFLSELSKHPELTFLLKIVGMWWLIGAILTVTIGMNVIYFVCRIFSLVLS
jgi:hypothetical protein